LPLIKVCAREKSRDALYSMYISYLPHMTKDNKMTFKEFYDLATVQDVVLDARPQDDIMSDILSRKDAY